MPDTEQGKEISSDTTLVIRMLKKLREKNEEHGPLTVHDLVVSMNVSGWGMLILMLALPISIPVPTPPGLSMFFGIPISIIAAQIVYGTKVIWLPKFILQRKMPTAVVDKVLSKLISVWGRNNFWTRHSLIFFSKSEITQRFVYGVSCFLCGLAMSIPIPLTHIIPGISVVMMSIGIVAANGFLIICGLLVSIPGYFISLMAVLKGPAIIAKITSDLISLYVNWYS